MTNLFWERFYNACISKGTKPNPVAKDIGVSSGIVSKWKTLGTLPNGDTLLKIADYLDCSVDYLLGRTDFPHLIIKDKNGNESIILVEAMSPNKKAPDNLRIAATPPVTPAKANQDEDELKIT